MDDVQQPTPVRADPAGNAMQRLLWEAMKDGAANTHVLQTTSGCVALLHGSNRQLDLDAGVSPEALYAQTLDNDGQRLLFALASSTDMTRQIRATNAAGDTQVFQIEYHEVNDLTGTSRLLLRGLLASE